LIFSNEALVKPSGVSVAPFSYNSTFPYISDHPSIFRFIKFMTSNYPYKVKIIIIVRRQPEWLASFYSRVSSRITKPSQQDFEKQVKNILTNNKQYLFWSLWVEKLISLIGSENVLCMPMEMMGQKTYWKNICDFIGGKEDEHNNIQEKRNTYSLGRNIYKIDHQNKKETSPSFLLSDNLIDEILDDKEIVIANKNLGKMIGEDLSKYGYY
ncbi:hypothetical protein, partial [Chromohalobacter sp. 48-RD10]|uniref:hypothetical protein n=1 Tax=Chromohalobacter sp. 48-RD10 TaxID=2994063 RepID=UPI0024688AFF